MKRAQEQFSRNDNLALAATVWTQLLIAAKEPRIHALALRELEHAEIPSSVFGTLARAVDREVSPVPEWLARRVFRMRAQTWLFLLGAAAAVALAAVLAVVLVRTRSLPGWHPTLGIPASLASAGSSTCTITIVRPRTWSGTRTGSKLSNVAYAPVATRTRYAFIDLPEAV